MKKIVTISLLVLLIVGLQSCGVSRKVVKAQATDLQSHENVDEGGVLLKDIKKVCILNSTCYKNELMDDRAFRGKQHSSHAEVDTVFRSNILADVALVELALHLPPGMQYYILDKENFVDGNGQVRLSMIKEQYQPDILIVLTDQCFYIKGNTDLISQRRESTIGLETTTGTELIYNRDVSICYENEWLIQSLGEQHEKGRKIMQTNRIKDSYSKYNLWGGNDLAMNLLLCAKRSGADCGSLFAIKR